MAKLVVGNWKMNPENEADAMALMSKLSGMNVPSGVEVVICPPAPYLSLGHSITNNIVLGAQDAFWADSESATGEVSPSMLKDLGVKYVIVGHSERREKMHETDAEVWRKIAAVIRDNMKPILCVGEPWDVRRDGRDRVMQYLSQQLLFNMASLTAACSVLDSIVIAYEPIWAISTSGTGQEETVEDAASIIAEIKKMLKEQCGMPNAYILYGGSVTSSNATGFLNRPEIDGVLVGKASLDAEEFGKIVENSRSQ